MSSIRVALRLIQSGVWQGGYNYLLNLCQMVGRFKSSEISMILFAGDDASESDLLPFRESLGARVIVDAAFRPKEMRRRQLMGALRAYDRVAERVLSAHGIDVVIENADFYGRKFPIRTIPWIPDFQHRHLPHLFAKSQYYRREIGFRLQIATKRTIMVSSEDAKQDLQRFYRLSPERVSAVPFSLPVPEAPSQTMLDSVRKRYALPDRFLICPNQFHPHKNHMNLAKAVALLAQSGNATTIICPGGDGYGIGTGTLAKVREYVETQNCQEFIRLPGRIPGEDLNCLFYASQALVNPSEFEGWSTTVEEAKAIGLPMLLSGLAVNREQTGNHAIYFAPNNVEEIANKLQAFLQSEPAERPSRELLTEDANRRSAIFADKFEAAIAKSLQPR